MNTLFNPKTVLRLIRLTGEEVSQLQEDARQGHTWHALNTAENLGFLPEVWTRGDQLWEGSSVDLRNDHLNPASPLWDMLLLAWAQTRLRFAMPECSRRVVAWSDLVKGFIVGRSVPYPGSADTAFQAAHARVLLIARLLGVRPIPESCTDTSFNDEFTTIAFGTLAELLLDPDQDLFAVKLQRAIGFLDQASKSVKSEDLAQARKILVELYDTRSVTPGARPRLTKRPKVDWRGVRKALNEALERRRQAGEDCTPKTVAEEMGQLEDYIRDLVDGLLVEDDDTLADHHLAMLMWLGSHLGVPIYRYLK